MIGLTIRIRADNQKLADKLVFEIGRVIDQYGLVELEGIESLDLSSDTEDDIPREIESLLPDWVKRASSNKGQWREDEGDRQLTTYDRDGY